jgi:hypothetical protein
VQPAAHLLLLGGSRHRLLGLVLLLEQRRRHALRIVDGLLRGLLGLLLALASLELLQELRHFGVARSYTELIGR